MQMSLTINGFPVEAAYPDKAVSEIFLPFLLRLRAMATDGRRKIVFLAAPPATGKSTLASFLEAYAATIPGMPKVQAVGMDGFHYPNRYLDSHTTTLRGETVPLRTVKGAPPSFDAEGLRDSLTRLQEADITWPVYDRNLHDPVPDALQITAPIVLVEGNWLLLPEPRWQHLPHDYSVFITAREEQLRQRLLQRKMRGGATVEEALRHYENSDGPNVRLCLAAHDPAQEEWCLDDFLMI